MAEGLSEPEAAQTRITALQQLQAAASLVFRGPPAQPTTCCGRGCNGCVWESYYAAVDWWCEDINSALAAHVLPYTAKI